MAATARLVWCVCACSTCAGLRVAVPSRLRHSRCLLRASDKEPEPPCAATVMWPGILRSGRLGPVDVDADAVWITRNITQLSRRSLLRGAAWAAGVYSGSGTISGAYASGASGRLVHCVNTAPSSCAAQTRARSDSSRPLGWRGHHEERVRKPLPGWQRGDRSGHTAARRSRSTCRDHICD